MRILTLTTAVLMGLATVAGAKGHDQDSAVVIDEDGNIVNDGIPGTNAGSETAAAAQGLGAALGNGKAAQGNLGNSANAGNSNK